MQIGLLINYKYQFFVITNYFYPAPNIPLTFYRLFTLFYCLNALDNGLGIN